MSPRLHFTAIRTAHKIRVNLALCENMQTLEEIKEQYARVLDQKDWVQFKYIADYYFDTAAKLKKRDVNVREELQLLVRNSQKRLFIGIGCEMLLKAIYLKSAYCINKYKNNDCLLYTSPSPRDLSTSRMPSSA